MTDSESVRKNEVHLTYQRCASCGHTWYFRRDFCPACGGTGPASMESSGNGMVYASSLVHRAPTDEFKALVPYTIVIVDMREGFRVMGHAEAGLTLNTAVRCEMRFLAGKVQPFFSKVSDVS